VGLFQIAILTRVKRFERRFCALYSLWKTGRLPQAPLRPSASFAVERVNCGERGEAQREQAPFDPGAVDAASCERARLRPASVLPRTVRWLQGMLPVSAGPLAGGVDSLMWNYPEMKAFAADCPQVGRLLRPMCRMLGLKVPEYLALPKRVRRARGDPSRKARGTQMARPRRRDFSNPRDEALAWLRWSEATKKPVDPRRMSAVAFGYILHWPRDGNCPPPEIGYGGRMFPPLPKDYEWPKD
jgi:hypothetical protein